ncbi:MAG: hypothetical protein FJZ96_09125 [Chloroflexi bacterium]|nr:hypothetical protein [Chloroflexota bacterium]
MAKLKQTKIVTKKHLARLERERRQVKAITYSAIAVIAIIIVLIGYGILNQTVLQARQPIVEVNDEVVTTRQFQARIRLERQQLINQYIQYAQFAQMFGMDLNTDNYFTQYMTDIENQLNNPFTLGSGVIETIINEIVIQAEADKLGITVTEEEVEASIRADFSYYPGGTPTPTVTPTSVTYPPLSATQLALVTATPTLEPQPTATLSPTSTAEANVSPTPAVTPTPTSIPPTATPYTLEGFQSGYQTNLESFASIGMSEADYRAIYATILLRQKVFDLVTVDVPLTQEQVWARHILVADEPTAVLVRGLLDGGGDFAALALQYSTDTSNSANGGDLGWFGSGAMVAEFEAAAFGLEIGEISQPVMTSHGYHIIQVLGHEDRALAASEYEQARQVFFNAWLEQVKEDYTITIHEYWISRMPEDPTLADALLEYSSQQ